VGAVAPAVTSAVPSAVPTASNTVVINGTPQRGPHKPMTGHSVVPYVPRTEEPRADEMAWQPSYATIGTTGRTLESGSPGAPSLPVDGFLFRRGPADPHYLVQAEGRNPYGKVNNPPTRGMLTWVKAYLNHVFNGKQNVDNAGWQQNSPQQRTSYMRITPPPHGAGYAPETAVPHQLPQQPNTYRFNPVLGTDAPGVVPGQAHILNRSTYGAGQTAGGVGGSNYTPPPGPPDTTPVASPQASGMPTWG
jgi:hypothetical protein